MRLSNYFLPVLKETPSEAKIPSHQLMLRAGMIRQQNSGIYSWLPYGLAYLKKIENIVREEMNNAYGIELLMPTMQPAELWKESGRGDYGKETLIVKDRHGRDLIYGPTNEEVITDIFRKNVKSYKDLPKNLYQIQWKFRDEIRPRFGVMRGREFLMKDAYSFDLDEESARKSYDRMYSAYFKIFKRLNLKAIPFSADTGIIGGDLSHEFQVIAKTGESEIFYDKKLEELIEEEEINIEEIKSLYSAADEKHNPEKCNLSENQIAKARGIEVGHIFYFDDKYSKPMNLVLKDQDGKDIALKMGAYGIGVSRLAGAIIEAHHDEYGMVLPESVSPFKVALINIKTGNEDCEEKCEIIYQTCKKNNIEIIYDDRKESAGKKFATADLLGIPYQIAIGPRSLENMEAELKIRKTGEKENISIDKIYDRITT